MQRRFSIDPSQRWKLIFWALGILVLLTLILLLLFHQHFPQPPSFAERLQPTDYTIALIFVDTGRCTIPPLKMLNLSPPPDTTRIRYILASSKILAYRYNAEAFLQLIDSLCHLPQSLSLEQQALLLFQSARILLTVRTPLRLYIVGNLLDDTISNRVRTRLDLVLSTLHLYRQLRNKLRIRWIVPDSPTHTTQFFIDTLVSRNFSVSVTGIRTERIVLR